MGTAFLEEVADKMKILLTEYIRKQVPEHLLKASSVFHLRGGMDYQKLTLLISMP